MNFKQKKIKRSTAEEEQARADMRVIDKNTLKHTDIPRLELSKREDIYLSIREVLALRR